PLAHVRADDGGAAGTARVVLDLDGHAVRPPGLQDAERIRHQIRDLADAAIMEELRRGAGEEEVGEAKNQLGVGRGNAAAQLVVNLVRKHLFFPETRECRSGERLDEVGVPPPTAAPIAGSNRIPKFIDFSRCVNGRLAVPGTQTSTCSSKKRVTQRMALGAAWPSPQIDSSAMTRERSPSSSRSQRSASISAAASAVPLWQGPHLPHDSCAKKRMRLRAAREARSWSERTTSAAEPMEQPCGSSVPKSSGRSAMLAGRIPPDAPPGR